MIDKQKQYYGYLLTKSRRAQWYHRFLVFPRIREKISGSIIDVGCGIGFFLDYAKSAIGVDINFYNLKHCRGRKHRVCLVGDGHYPFREKTFDSALMDNVLEHLQEPQEVLSEIHRILKRNGTLIVGVPGKKGFLRDKDHEVFYDQSSLQKVMMRSGFNAIEMFYTPFKWDWLDKNISAYCLYGVFART